mmetsp:Transcript_15185/g.49827  ORF Transcript_15185/g.49827 Transcript_15185/m.49827 type:complete len:227 (+) Transcript_15185:242-922(+)
MPRFEVLARAGQESTSVRRKRSCAHACHLRSSAPHHLERLQIPKPHRLVHRRCRHQQIGRVKLHGGDGAAVGRKLLEELARSEVVEPHHAILAARDDPPPVRAEGALRHPARVPFVRVDAVFATNVPDFEVGVLRARGEKLAVRVKVGAQAPGPVPRERPHHLGYAEVPQLERPARCTRNHEILRLVKRHALHRRLVTHQAHHRVRLSHGPHVDLFVLAARHHHAR